MKELLKYIKKYNRIIIFGHQRPDGDCIGSQYGLYYILKDSFPEKEIYISGESSDYVSFIGSPSFVADELLEGSLAICVDSATSERISDSRFNKCNFVIKIDHHVVVDEYGDYAIVDDKAAACAQIIIDFYLQYKDILKMSANAATALYVGISTDTGRFKYDCVTSKTFNYAAILLDHGVDLSYVDNNLSVETLESLKLRGYCLSNFIMSNDGFAYIKMTRDVIEKFGVSDETAASMVSAISTIEGCPVWAMFIEYPTEIRIRLRSRGPIINLLAEKYGGGGHPKAAGAHLDCWDDLDKFVLDANNLVKEYKKQ